MVGGEETTGNRRRPAVIQLSDEAAERLERSADEAEQGIGVSPTFTSLEDSFAYLDEETRKYKEGKGSQ